MAFCKYCGRPLNNGQRCTCNESREEEIKFAREQEILRKQYYLQQQKKARQIQKNIAQNHGQNVNGQNRNIGQDTNRRYSTNGLNMRKEQEQRNIAGVPVQGWDNINKNNSKEISAKEKDIVSIIIDTFRNPIDAVKNLGRSNSLSNSFMIIGICMFIILFEMLIASVASKLLITKVVGENDISIVGATMKYTFLILCGLFLWGLLVAGVMFVVSKYIFHEEISFIQTYAVITIKAFASTVLFTGYVIFFIAISYLASLFKEEVVIKLAKFAVLVLIAVILFPNLIFNYGYYEILNKKPSVKIYEILVMNLILLIVSYIIGIIVAHILQEHMYEFGSSFIMNMLGF